MSVSKQHFSGDGKVTEKSNFAQTCNRLSLFLKEKGNLRDLLGTNRNCDALERPESSPATKKTVDLLTNMDKTGQKAVELEKSMDLLPEYVSLDSFCNLEGSTDKASSSKAVAATESKAAQMTIFYGGQVFVFDDIPADRARGLMRLASCCSPSNRKIRDESASISPCPSDISNSHELIHEQLQANGSDLPIARRASLHKFLAKRKDRATVRAPYQLHRPPPAAAPSRTEHKFDLNL